MKKIFLLFLIALFAVSLVACGGEEPEDPATLIIQFVPSTSVDSALLTKVKSLEEMLEAELLTAGYEINVNISIGTSYASVIEAMASGQVHVGFLTAQQYAFITTEYPGKAEVLLTSVRNAYNAQIVGGAITDDPAVIIANANATGYDASTTSAHKVSSYYSMLLVRNADYAAYQANGIANLAGKNVGTQSATSGSGYVYPSFLLQQNDLKFVTGTPNAAAGEVKSTVIGGHQNSVLALLNNEVDAVFTFFDARANHSTYTAWLENPANAGKTVIGETKVVALTTGIYNDTISTVSSLSDGLREALADAFIAVIATTPGAEALAIYNHTGYLKANDADYDGERALYEFLQANS
ncbi:MAG: phosphate/phosphite/phosphonate ABC transporter substrate-binding protein [Firmicutes bacterium]|nr:phosphate/phosphite/phosphonate ABC transporter substrate-binding protein [Bacillota bacterium]